jgi:predicted acetyltransferase
MIPYQLKLETTISLAGYISGAMTHPDSREKGCMSQLLEFSFQIMKKKGYDYTFLIPQEEWLFEFYRKRGYQPFISPSLKDIKDFKDLKDFKEHTHFLTTLPNAVLKSEEQFANIVADCSAEGNSIIDPREKRGMIKKLNPLAKTVTNLYLGRMFD